MASTVVKVQVSPEQASRLQKKARKLGITSSEMGAILLEEALRRDEFSFIDFRDAAVGRQAYIEGTRLAVWQVASIVSSFKGSVTKAAEHFSCSPFRIQVAMSYAKGFPDEMVRAIEENRDVDFKSLKRLLPKAEKFRASKRRR